MIGRSAVVAATACLALATACGATGEEEDAAPEDAAVCDAVQGIVDNVLSGDGAQEQALLSLGDLQIAVGATDNDVMATQGDRLFNAISQLVDPGGLTIDESIDLGRRVGVESAEALAAIVDECAAVGQPIDRLDEVPVDQEMVDIVEQYGSDATGAPAPGLQPGG